MEDVEALRERLSAGKDEFMARTNELEGLLNDCAQELDALLNNKKSMLLGLVASLERDAENNKKEVEMEWPDLSLLLENPLTEIDEQMVLLQDDKKCYSAARLISERQNVMDVLKGCGLDSKSSITSNFLILPCRLLVAVA